MFKRYINFIDPEGVGTIYEVPATVNDEIMRLLWEQYWKDAFCVETFEDFVENEVGKGIERIEISNTIYDSGNL
jgi:hypothetical protein